MGTITLITLLLLEVFFLIWSIKTKNNHTKEKGICSISLFMIFLVLMGTGVYEWSFRYYVFFLILTIQTIFGLIILLNKNEKTYKVKQNIFRLVNNSIIFAFTLSLAILFPQYTPIKTTGNNEVAMAKFTWVDDTRIEEFSNKGGNRELTVEFWYPAYATETYPLVVFSHGAFGFSGSNYSTFAELASNGYVVASISHTYHAFYTMDSTNKFTIVNNQFIQNVVDITNDHGKMNQETIFNTTKEWMNLRVNDENFVINKILSNSADKKESELFSIINKNKIGLIGHSLGGASSAQLGRERNDIDAVIVLDGTMLGEEVAYENNAVVLNDTPYPIPLLNVYAEDHYTNSKKMAEDSYENFNATKHAVHAYETVFLNAGHLNFTDLPLFSPTLAKMLGIGTIDSRYAIETMNKVVLKFFNHYLKDEVEFNIEKEY